MIIDLISLDQPQKSFDFTLEPEEINLEDDAARLKGPVKVSGELRRGLVQTDVSGQIETDVNLECARCLTEVEQHLKFSFAAAFVAPENYTGAKEAELNGGDLDVSIVENDRLDLTELVREQILLNLPEQVFCREDCRGLCPACGADLSRADCGCDRQEIDPRWAGLKNLK